MHDLQVPVLQEPIEWRPGLKVIGVTADGQEVTPELVDFERTMIRRMNAAIKLLPDLSA
jgi:hypothetical protein